MKLIRHTETLYYYDGPQVFEACDGVGGHYIGLMVEADGQQDQYLIVEVEPERLQQFRNGTLDLRSLLTERGNEEWFLAKPNGDLDSPLALQPQPTASVPSSYLPEPGFLLQNSKSDSTVSRDKGRLARALYLLAQAHPGKTVQHMLTNLLPRLDCLHQNLLIRRTRLFSSLSDIISLH